MATLEKIRNKSVLLFIIIIVALLAFILGDFLTSGRTYFGSPTTVAKVGDVKVDYQDYQRRISDLSEQSRTQNRNISSDALASQALNSLVAEQLMNNELDELGIVVTDAELSDAMYGAGQDPRAAQLIGQISQFLNLQSPDAHAVYDAVQNPTRYGRSVADGQQIGAMISNLEKTIESERREAKFGRLVSGLFTYNKLDAQAVYDNVATTRHIAYAVKEASSIPTDSVDFSDADVQALYNSRRNTYAIDEERRQIDYIYVRIEPSQADRVAATNAVENAIMGLNESEGLEAIAADGRFVSQNDRAAISQITDRNLRSFLDTATIGEARVISRANDEYVLAKLLAVSDGIDSINVTTAGVAENVDIDSILNAINNGSTVAALSLSGDVRGVDSIWTSLETPDVDAKLHAALASAPVGTAFIYNDTINGQPLAGIYKVNRRHAPVKFYDYARISFTVDPTQNTLDELSESLRTYVSNNSSAAEFSANAAEAGFPVLSDEVGASSVRIGNAADSRKFIKWVMEADKGQVSPVFQDDKQEYYIAIAVTDVFDKFRPFNSPRIYNQLRAEALDSKKAAQLMARYNGAGNDLASYAQAMGVEVAEGDVNITSPILLSLGVNESELQGAIAATEAGAFAGPVQGKHGIMVFEVRDINTANRPFSEEEYGQLFLRNYTPLRNPQQLLLGKEKIENRSLNFIANPAD